jgi:osmotically-inducible protein OsmY
MTSDPSLSFAAKNVTVVTTGTNVYLRGTVRSAQERDRIEHIARSQAGAGNVDDGLVVTP